MRVNLPGLFRIRVEGAERLPREGPLLIVATRCGALDLALLQMAAGRPVCQAADSPLFLLPGVVEFARLLGAVGVPPDLDGHGDARFAAMGAALDEGHAVGHFLRLEGAGLDPEVVEVLLATRAAGVPVAPVALHGDGEGVSLGGPLPDLLGGFGFFRQPPRPRLHRDYLVKVGEPVYWRLPEQKGSIQDFVKAVERSLGEVLRS